MPVWILLNDRRPCSARRTPRPTRRRSREARCLVGPMREARLRELREACRGQVVGNVGGCGGGTRRVGLGARGGVRSTTCRQVDAKPGDGKVRHRRRHLRTRRHSGGQAGRWHHQHQPGHLCAEHSNDNALRWRPGDLDVYGQLTISGGGADKRSSTAGASTACSPCRWPRWSLSYDRAQRACPRWRVRRRHRQPRQLDPRASPSQPDDLGCHRRGRPGGVFNVTLQLPRCKVIANTAADVGGGTQQGILTVWSTGAQQRGHRSRRRSRFNTATIILSTIADNTAVGTGGSIENGGR